MGEVGKEGTNIRTWAHSEGRSAGGSRHPARVVVGQKVHQTTVKVIPEKGWREVDGLAMSSPGGKI